MNATSERARETTDILVRDEDSARHADAAKEQIQSDRGSEEEDEEEAAAAADFCVGNDR